MKTKRTMNALNLLKDMSYFSMFYEIDVRDEIVREFTDSTGQVDDMLAGLHEVRARLVEEHPLLKHVYEGMKPQKIMKKSKISAFEKARQTRVIEKQA